MEYLTGLNERQKEAVLHIKGPLLIVAGAGAGKTKTITHRAAYMIKSGIHPSAILAVTFTNKAAAEMRNRIAALLPPSEGGSAVPFTTTFHSLGVRILREFADAAGIPRSFVIWDRDDSIRALKRVLAAAGLENRFPPRQVARKLGRKQAGFGAFLDSTLDRLAEIFLFAGFLYFFIQQDNQWMVATAYAALTGSLMVSYVRARAEALGYECKVGILSRVERYIVMIVTLLLNRPEWGLIVLALFTYLTLAQRMLHVWRQAHR